MLRPGRTLSVAVFRPFAEQVAALASVTEGDRVLELAPLDGELTARLRAAAGAHGAVEQAHRPWNFTQAEKHFDVAVSLMGIEAQDELHAVLPQLSIVANRTLIVVAAGGATYDNALRNAWRDVSGTELVALPVPDPVVPAIGWRQRRLSDVARFDDVEQLLTALTSERGIEVPPAQRDALRDRLASELAPFTAADGTMRIPVHATLVERAGRAADR